MFATLLGRLPRPPGDDGRPIEDDDLAVVAALDAQAEAGLEPLTDGRLRSRGPFGAIVGLDGLEAGPDGPRLSGLPRWRAALTVDAWRFATGHASGLVKQALPGPYTLGRRLGADDPDASTMAFAAALRSEVLALAEAGCAFVEIEERDAHLIGADEVERRRFADAHRSLLDGMEGVHLSLAIIGGNADTAGIETILAAPYRSLAVDLIDGPDNWRLVTNTPGDRGIVCGALSTRHPSDDSPELLLWAVGYAAASEARGPTRVGLATAGGLGGLSWDLATTKLKRLGEAARLAGLPLAEAAPRLDPRAIDIRSGAAGRYVPRDRRKGRRPSR
jgi:methionine synthase II (cobalamin-independent)